MERKRRMNMTAINKRAKELGLSRQDIADHIGVSRQCVDMWFQKHRNPTWENIYALAEALQTNFENIIVDVTKTRDIVQLEMQEAVYDYVTKLLTRLEGLIDKAETPQEQARLIESCSNIIEKHFEKLRLYPDKSPLGKNEAPREPFMTKAEALDI